MFRVVKQRLREARVQGVDFLILCLAGVCLGTLAKMSDETFGALGYTYTIIAVCKSETTRTYMVSSCVYIFFFFPNYSVCKHSMHNACSWTHNCN